MCYQREWKSRRLKIDAERLLTSQVPQSTWNFVGICPDHWIRLNTTWWPIVNKYREGKLKRTPEGEWNRTWNRMSTIGGSAIYVCATTYLLHNEPTSCYYVARLSLVRTEPKRKRVWIGRFSNVIQTRNPVSYLWPRWSLGDTRWRPELVCVEKYWDELWVGAKDQSNREIAGSPRNIFRYSLVGLHVAVKHSLG